MLQLITPHADARQLKRMVSPVFFQLFSAGALARQVARLLSAPLDREGLEEAASRLNEELFDDASATRIQVDGRRRARRKAAVGSTSRSGAASSSASHLGDEVLRIYFAQLLSTSVSFLDLSYSAFDETEQTLIWTPSGVIYEWDDEFRGAFVEVCVGYYRGQADRFTAGLRALRLEPERAEMLAHFGGADDAARFDLRDFHRTFGRVFDSCAARGVRLHPDFIPLGVMLGTLYAHLARYDRGFDRSRAFESAHHLLH